MRLTMEEIVFSDRCVIIFYDKVFDLEEYMHPGGQDKILANCNADGTVDFAENHEESKLVLVKDRQIGVLMNGMDDPCGDGSAGTGGVMGDDDDDGSTPATTVFVGKNKGKDKNKGKNKGKGKKKRGGRKNLLL